MRYLLLILLLAGGYYGWDYYQTGLVPRHEAIKAMEQEPYPELDAAQARFDEAAELHERPSRGRKRPSASIGMPRWRRSTRQTPGKSPCPP